MKKALDSINERILAAFSKRQSLTNDSRLPRLVAVSKLKPVSSIIEAYECGQRYFGENYIQELVEKSNTPEIIAKCPDIRFHFIGHLQSNKVGKLLKVRNLHMIETVDSIKLADLLNKAIDKLQLTEITLNNQETEPIEEAKYDNEMCQMPLNQQLKVMIQVNTSGEEQKNGILPDDATNLAEHIMNKCRWLNLAGIMTIGRYDGWGEGVPNQDFVRMLNLKDILTKRLSIEPNDFELSMGMSGDFEEAIEIGSTSVRVGTLIFGERPAKNS